MIKNSMIGIMNAPIHLGVVSLLSMPPRYAIIVYVHLQVNKMMWFH